MDEQARTAPAPNPPSGGSTLELKRADADERLDIERRALAVHRAALRGSGLPRPKATPRGAFLHGFLLPFSLIASTLRDRSLRGPYLKTFAARLVVVAIAGALLFLQSKPHREDAKRALHVRAPGITVDVEEPKNQITILGQAIPIDSAVLDSLPPPPAPPPPSRPAAPTEAAASRIAPPPPPAPSLLRLSWNALQSGWLWSAALVGLLSVVEGVVVFLTRRYDDWLSFHASSLAGILPEEDSPKAPGIAIDVRWLLKRLRRRLRGYVVLAAGLPLIVPLQLVPAVGAWLFSGALTIWGWYWLGVFTAAKSGHAWIDEGKVGSPALIRRFNERVAEGAWRGPLRWYGRTWARLTRGVDPPATTFERAPAAFLGLALARALLAFPGLYLLARPLVPVAAGRLCAEVDPQDRFSLKADDQGST